MTISQGGECVFSLEFVAMIIFVSVDVILLRSTRSS